VSLADARDSLSVAPVTPADAPVAVSAAPGGPADARVALADAPTPPKAVRFPLPGPAFLLPRARTQARRRARRTKEFGSAALPRLPQAS